jgi:hypothetical protein
MKNVLFFAITILYPLASWGADDFKPMDVKTGLWESTMTNQMSGQMPIPAEALAKLTPEQRARIEQAMKARASQGPKTSTNRSCVTKEQLNKPMTFNQDQKDNCKSTLVRSSSSEQDIRMVCNESNVQANATVHIQAVDSENVKGNVQITASGGGNTMNSQSSFTAKWVSSDCGSLKPGE